MTQPIRRIEELFQRAADLPREERAAFLERECPDPELRDRVRKLLRSHEEGESFIAPLLDPGSLPSEGPGTVIGRYKLLQHIGEGGFGSVYMAEQTEPVVRKVALKIIKLGMDTKAVVARFEAERQALALMEHPNIARVLDGGATETGRPYFVMELVRGIAITEYCDQANLATDERLALFMEVCQAVQHAHQKGIIHRDLKPSNVLVTLHDGKPVPKVIDFGIAKAMHGRLTEKTLFTEFRQFIGTPAYMSPEQAEMSGLDIDTRTDIYSLGVLLYELLTGSTPFDTKALLEAGYGEIQRIIREKEPPRPSVRISTQGSAEIARHRRIDVHALSRLLRGDLDWIVMRALEKDRSRRYASASELAQDVRRHLGDEPVQAGPPGAAYRVRKFLKRNRAAVGWTATITLALLAGIAGTTWGVLRAARERAVAVQNMARANDQEQAAARAHEEADRQSALAWQAVDQARDVTAFLTETLALSSPVVTGSTGLTMRQMLDRASEQVTRLSKHPYAEASVRGTIGRAYRSLSENQLAEPHLRRATELMRELRDFDRVERYQTLWALTVALFGLGASDAMQAAMEARAVGLEAMRAGHPELADMLARFLQAIDAADMTAAKALFDSTRARERAEIMRGDPLWTIWVGAIQDAGYSQWYSPLEASTEPFWTEAYAIQERELGPANPETAESLAMLAGVLQRSGRAPEAEARVRESARVMRSIFGPQHPQTAFSESILAENLISQGRFAEAEPILLAAHGILMEVHDASNFCQMDSLKRVVGMYDAWKKPDVAAPYRTELARRCALAPMLMPYPLLRRLFEEEAAEVLAALDRLQSLADLGSQGMPPPAQPTPGLADVHEVLASLCPEKGRLWEPSNPMTALLGRMLVIWGGALEGRVRPEDRSRMSATALELLQPWRERIPRGEMADALALRAATVAREDRGHAEALAREAFALVQATDESLQPGKQNWIVALTWLRVGRTLGRLGLAKEAEPLLRTAHETLSTQVGRDNASTHAASAALSECYTLLGRLDEAARYADSSAR